ncbi:MAG: hypothetical protein Q8L53_00205 [Aestuariivirga sp.]|nr:hypothetical protein [Aestuariivirga sp.]
MHRLGQLVIGVAVAGIIFWIGWTSPSLKQCLQEAYYNNPQQPLQEYVANLYGSLLGYRLCVGDLVHANGNGIIAVFTVVLGIATWFLWRAARDLVQEIKTTGSNQIAMAKTAVDAAIESNRLSRELFVSSERPWVLVDHVQVKSALVFDETGVHLDFDLTLKNTGKSPARNVTVEARLYPMSPSLSDPGDEKTAFVLSAEDSKTYVPKSRMVLHHGQDETLQRHVFIPRKEMEKAISLEDTEFIIPVIIGSVRYEFIADNEFHYTHFMYAVSREPEGYRVGINPLDGTIPQKQLRLIRDLSGCYST